MVSIEERKRRYKAIYEAMDAYNISLFIVAGREGAIGRGYIRYLSDWYLWGGTGFLAIAKDSEPTMLLGSESQVLWASQIGWVTDIRFSSPIINGLVKIIRDAGSPQKVHIAGMGKNMMPDDLMKLKETFPKTEFIDATRLMENIVLVKSNEEILCLQETANIVAASMEAFKNTLKPGVSEREAASKEWEIARAMGVLDGSVHVAHHTVPFVHPPTDYRFKKEDIIKLSVEMAGPSGYWIELSGVFSFGPPPNEMLREFNTTKKAVEAARALLKPGTVGNQIPETIESVFKEDGWENIGRIIWDAHGIGLDVIEFPVIQGGNQFILKENMVISMHPGLVVGKERMGVYVQDNYVVRPDGAIPQSPWLHQWHIID